MIPLDRPGVLVVDDKQANLLAMKTLLADLDIDLVLVNSGLAAVEKTIEREFACVLLDVQMPEIDGLETAAMMRLNEATKTTPIIFITAMDADKKIMFEGYEAGAVDFLYKPIEPVLLKNKLKVFLEIFRQRGELERSNDALNSFAHMAAHDLKAPIRQISSYAGIVRRDFSSGKHEDIYLMLSSISDAAKRMNDLVVGLLSFAEVGATPPEYYTINLTELLEDVMANFATEIEELGIEISLAELPSIQCSTVHLCQVFHNLISNAIKYRDAKRRLVIKITGKINREGRSCTIVVDDNGIGFDNKLAQDIFKPFKRAVGRSKYEGSGIGLATVSKAIEVHKGTITAFGIPEAGSVFTITLPLTQK
ncbi:MAG: response regulator [Cohaesibacteraceae bacterium]|nr:response regulator [Cohaesibacteraceae bacterium]MBL4876981.1 response regulator [Cohaesibacteraceae bacterium]